MTLFGCCFAKKPTSAAPAGMPPEIALRMEVLEKQVKGMADTLNGLASTCVTRSDLATMAGVEVSKLGDTKLKTGAGWRFLDAGDSVRDVGYDEGDEPPMDRVSLS